MLSVVKLFRSITFQLALSAFLMALAGWMALLYAPTEKSMGDVQRIFYIHVPAAWIAFLAFFVVFGASFGFLATQKPRWDALAAASAEIGVLFITLVLVTGPLWAKPVWNTYWTWDARLTTSLILWLIYIGYLLIRSYTRNSSRSSTLAAVYGIVGFIDVPIVYFSIRWWRTLHPSHVVGPAGRGLAPSMALTLTVALIAFTALYAVLLRIGYKSRLLEYNLIGIESLSKGAIE
ncbi:cytochrome c biogenesis protein CcsA [candidate division KSB1 bacterium]|nr:cytochrome c biogenesis protein CcsA [candidate division KSB1 bacterium]